MGFTRYDPGFSSNYFRIQLVSLRFFVAKATGSLRRNEKAEMVKVERFG